MREIIGLVVDYSTNPSTEHYVTELVEDKVIPFVSSVTMRQARLQLSVLGVYATVNSAVSGMGEQAEIEWEYGATVDRSNPLTAGIVQLLGWTQQQTDDYFTAASRL